MQSLKTLPAPLLADDPVNDDPVSDDPVTALLLSMLPVAALLLDAEGRVTQANLAGRALLDAGDGLVQAPDGHLRTSSLLEDRGMSQILGRTLGSLLAAARRGHDSAAPCAPLRLLRPSGRLPYLLVIDPVPTQSVPLGNRAVLLVRIIDPEPESEGRIYPLQAAFELTAAESRIAELIATGRSTGRTAQDLALSTNTVRTHLARIFDKTGVRSQHALVRLLMALGSWPTG